jgi:hypothetical protein
MRDGLDRLGSQRLAILLFLTILLPVITLTNLQCSFSKAQSKEADNAFQAMIEIPTKPGIRLLTEKSQYHREDWIGIRVENRTNQVLWFTDQSLGLRAFQYDEQNGSWHQVDLGSVLADPHITTVTPGPNFPLASDLIPVQDIKASVKIRLVITGTTDQGGLFIAYRDIEIVD